MGVGLDDRRAKLGELIGLRKPKNVVLTSSLELESPIAESRLWRIVLTVDGRESIPCLLYRPVVGRLFRPVIALHQHNNEYAFGKSEPAGLDGNRSAAYGLRLATEGFLVIAPDLEGFEDRRWTHDVDGEYLAAASAVTRGGSLHGDYVSDVLSVSMYLQNRDDVSGGVSIIGHSLGGQIAFLALALDDRVNSGLISAGVTTLLACERREIKHNPGWYIPGLARFGDYGAVARLCSGKKAVVVPAEGDLYFPADGAEEVISNFPTAELRCVWRGGGHELTEADLTVVTREAVDAFSAL